MGKDCCGGGETVQFARGKTANKHNHSHDHEGEEDCGDGSCEPNSKSIPLSEEEKSKIDEIKVEKVAYYLRRKVKTSNGVAGGKHVEYFRGVKAAKILLAKDSPFADTINRKRHAVYILGKVMQEGYFHKARDVKQNNKRALAPVHQDDQEYSADNEPFIWTYEVGQWKSTLIGVGCLLAIVIFTLQPLWPRSMQVGVGYLFYFLLLLLGLLFALTLVRLILFVAVYILTGTQGYFWLYPNLYTEEEFWASFVPLYNLWWKGQDDEFEDEGEGEVITADDKGSKEN